MADLETRRGYREDHKSFGLFLKSDQHLDPAKEAANDIAAIARATAPKGNRRTKSKFAAGFKVVRQKTLWKNTSGGHPNPRLIMRVENKAPHAASIEFGNKRGARAHRILAKAGAQVGEFRPTARGHWSKS